MPDRQNSGNYATMGVKRFLCAVGMVLLLPMAALARDAGSGGVSGSVTPGAQSVDHNSDSSKFNEYRDIRDGAFLSGFNLEALNTKLGRFFELRGKNVFRDDQNILASMGRRGRWDLEIEWDDTPHRLSNKARTPYIESTDSRFVVPATVSQVYPGLLKELAPATGGGLTGGQKQQANDALTEAWLDTYLHSVGLGNDRKKGTASLDYALRDNLILQLDYSRENRNGNKIAYGTIGDRPPRTLNIQFTEPIDYQTQELKLDTDFSGKSYQVDFAYLVSNFENSNDTLTWQNIYTDPTAGTFEAWGGATARNVATFGQRPLPQDNRFQNLSFAFGIDLPMASRLSGSAAYSVAKQDESLIPYSTNGTLDAVAAGDGLAWNDPAKLPRRTADAEVKTKLINFDYTVNPVQRLNLKAFFRIYDLSNNTPMDQWRYVTQDTTGATGSVSYLNKRRNLAYEYDKKNFGLDTTYNLALWSTALSLGYEREDIDREYREADTDENILRVTVRSRPTSWFNFRIKYLFGNRDADAYDGEAAHESYWYAPADATDNVDSQFTFENHPDARRFDVTDRDRKQLDLLATLVPNDVFDLSASYRYRKDDYESNVTPSQPLLNYDGGRATITAADRAAFTPGDQVGLLKDERKFYGLDIAYNPTKRLRISAYTNREDSDTRQRGFEFNENNKLTPTAISAATEFGPWTRESMQWTADVRDVTDTYGVGAGFTVTPGKLDINTDFSYTAGRVDILYGGWGAQSSVNPANTQADNTDFAFRSPPTVRNDRVTLNINTEYKAAKNITVNLGYMFERFKIRDWQQESATPWYEAVAGNEYILRDSSLSSQWGNRLPNLGSYLAPSYKAHIWALSITYAF